MPTLITKKLKKRLTQKLSSKRLEKFNVRGSKLKRNKMENFYDENDVATLSNIKLLPKSLDLKFPQHFRNKIICGDAVEIMKQIPSGVIRFNRYLATLQSQEFYR